MLDTVPADLETALRAELPASAFPELGAQYLEEPRGRYAGSGGLLVAPGSAAEVATVLRLANGHRVGVVPYSGGTGLVGGQIAPEGPPPVILSLQRMNAIRAVHARENVLVAEAGAILADVQDAAAGVDRLFPLSLASEGSARVGGVLATNAGGVNVLRYGNARDLCLGVEAVLANGEIWHGLTRLRKNNMGYDLRNLLIGAEGTLGVITAAALRLYPRPNRHGVAMLQVTGPEAALDLLSLAGEVAGDAISAFELISGMGMRFLAETMADLRLPFAEAPDWCVLIDLAGASGFDPEGALETLYTRAAEAGLVQDGIIAQSEAQAAALWAVRENIPEANRRIGSVSSHDISVPLSQIPDFITQATAALSAIGTYRINCFGHVGDGNLHYNVFPMPGETRADHEEARPAIKRCVHDIVHAMGGSVSAEHGVGRLKVEDLERYGDPVKLAAMRAIKDALDPNGILNPGAVLRQRA
ncbi:FAD-binding oxidoreductase [Dinoroseobacter sp. S375]|uniref:FAD-binding oxidoreductase n=1 Tax=Dinoroseobacter sp. S375 TaxID=3415136 RepID=UPI003C7CDFBF